MYLDKQYSVYQCNRVSYLHNHNIIEVQKDYDYLITGPYYSTQYQSLSKIYIHTYIFNQATTHELSEYLAYFATHTHCPNRVHQYLKITFLPATPSITIRDKYISAR